MSALFRTWLLTLILSVVTLFSFSPLALAQLQQVNKGHCDQLGVNCQNLGDADPAQWVGAVLKVLADLLSFMALIAVVMVIWAGVRYMTSGGDEKKTEKAKTQILYAVIGLVIIGLSGLFVNIIIGVFFQQ